MLVRHLCDIRRHRLEPLMLEFGSGADNATRRGRDWRLFGVYRFENQATRIGITYNALATKTSSCRVFAGSSSLPDTKCQGPSLTCGQKGRGMCPPCTR